MKRIGPLGMPPVALQGEVDEGNSQVVSIRETDAALEPLIFSLVGLGVLTLVATVAFWWVTRPRPGDGAAPLADAS